jgi:hypothetical protein
VLDSLRLVDNYLVVDFHADSLLNHHLLNGMRRGLTSSAQFRVQLWQKRRRWFGSNLLTERRYEIKSTYDTWEQKYVLITAEERRLTSAMDFVRRQWERHRVALAEVSRLDSLHRYFVAIELQVEPVSKESLNEIRGWLAGEIKTVTQRDSADAAGDKKRKDVPDRLLDLIINLTGFGKRVISVKSGMFRVNQNGEIEMEK